MNNQTELRVWDPLVRIFHWSLVGAFAIAWLAEDEWMTLHSYAGYLIGGLLAFRLIWGIVGSRYSRFTDFVKSPGAVFGYLKDLSKFKARRYIGHNPAGGAMIVVLLLSLLTTVTSGMLAYGATGAGPMSALFVSSAFYGCDWCEELHEFFANFTLLLVVVHLGGVLFESLLHKENLVRAMFTGIKKA